MYKCFLAIFIFGFLPTLANAALIYQFDTTLKLESGSDSDRLNGAKLSFTAIISDGATYSSQYGSPNIHVASNGWTITGSNIDGIYVASNGVEWTASYNGGNNAGWFSGSGGFMSGIADLSLVAIFHHAVTNIHVGDLVKSSDFGPLITGTQEYLVSADSSSYNYLDNASFSVSNASTVPLPSTLPLFIVGLFLLLLVNRTNDVRAGPFV
jgi:hypothetical protein